MRRLLIATLFLGASFIATAQAVPANQLKKARASFEKLYAGVKTVDKTFSGELVSVYDTIAKAGVSYIKVKANKNGSMLIRAFKGGKEVGYDMLPVSDAGLLKLTYAAFFEVMSPVPAKPGTYDTVEVQFLMEAPSGSLAGPSKATIKLKPKKS